MHNPISAIHFTKIFCCWQIIITVSVKFHCRIFLRNHCIEHLLVVKKSLLARYFNVPCPDISNINDTTLPGTGSNLELQSQGDSGRDSTKERNRAFPFLCLFQKLLHGTPRKSNSKNYQNNSRQSYSFNAELLKLPIQTIPTRYVTKYQRPFLLSSPNNSTHHSWTYISTQVPSRSQLALFCTHCPACLRKISLFASYPGTPARDAIAEDNRLSNLRALQFQKYCTGLYYTFQYSKQFRSNGCLL